VVADVPSTVDDMCLRAIGPGVGGDQRITEYPDMAAVVAALTAWEQRPGRSAFAIASRQAGASTGNRALRTLGRVVAAAAALVVVAGVGMSGVWLARSADSPWGINPDAASEEVLTTIGEASGRDDAMGVGNGIVPVDVFDFDPLGDGAESPDLVTSAIDQRSDTAWTTDTYPGPDLGGKGGAGLVLDLGTSQPVSAVRLELLGSGSSVKVLLAPKPYRKPSKWTVLAQADAIGTAIDLRAPRPVVGRYVLIWFTQVPVVDGTYQGGIRDVIVLR
jgi:putative peptidoglycan lipid II flippase